MTFFELPNKQRLIIKLTFIILCLVILLIAFPLYAQQDQSPLDISEISYKPIFGLDSRLAVWAIAEVHLLLVAFTLGLPIVIFIFEIVCVKTGDTRYDTIAFECLRLVLWSFAATAALGVLLGAVLFSLYPQVMQYMSNVFAPSSILYIFLFIGQALCLYIYYFSWDSLTGNKKWIHISLGALLNIFGTATMFAANAWVTFMMSPEGIDTATGNVTSMWSAINNSLWWPMNIHRLVANMVFGAFAVGAYASMKFLTAPTEEERGYSDWMGYNAVFIGIVALLPLPFTGYWLGKEIYSASPVMGNIMMTGEFSWGFIVQAILLGTLFVGINYYLWLGMDRIKGSERYKSYTKYINATLFVCLAVWLIPHNLPLIQEGKIVEDFHPLSKYLGGMHIKNAAINLIILSTLFTLLLHRRSNKGETIPFTEQGSGLKISLFFITVIFASILFLTAIFFYNMDLKENIRGFIIPVAVAISIQGFVLIFTIIPTFQNYLRFSQNLLFISTIILAIVFLTGYGFYVTDRANLILRYISGSQVLLVLTCLIMNLAFDVILFRKAKIVEGITWGKIPARAQYTLIVLFVSVVMIIALMGYIRSGLRMNWHIYKILQDTSLTAYTPSIQYMGRVIAIIVGIFFGIIILLLWLSSLQKKRP
ncbi:MAG: cytochrome ubiquinol oxidase subunit I [Candidatus Scalindua sediminis]|nr:cytochrome ubiquinol oxidase subunit I [Candidatus Scalindua sediminis]